MQSKATWTAPEAHTGQQLTGLKVKNSLVQDNPVVPFVPLKDKTVKWYMCGPTVYDLSHMGHARTYICFDTLRKIMRDYFGYNVIMQVNITDIDDKIIKRANEQKVNFTEFSQRMEKEFWKDMQRLNVETPEILTRVSEFVPEIIAFIQKIIENGHAYESNGSVYFDVEHFKADGKYHYGCLEPTAINDAKLLAEGEGVLNNDTPQEKRSDRDFALWKKSKPDEPWWDSPWGKGRPGWHIECSAMAASHLDHPLDIHSGGVDLKFPHHTNEIAQSEAYYQKPQWVNYFLHTGHLHIDGLKMSKSLKNFISIQTLLESYNARQLRILFLLHKYDTLMNYNQNSLSESVNKEKNYKHFFANMAIHLKDHPLHLPQKWAQREFVLHDKLELTKERVYSHLSNNFNTPDAIAEIDSLINATYVYLKDYSGLHSIVKTVLEYIDFVFSCMGLQFMQQAQGDSQKQAQHLNNVIQAFTDFRLSVRTAAVAKDFSQVLTQCDSIRDEVLPPLGIRLEDVNNTSVFKLDEPENILKEIALKKKAKEEQEEMKRKRAAAAAEKAAKMKIPPQELFLSQTDKYSAFDENGIPTKDQEGNELSKGATKKVKKEWDTQKTNYEKYLASLKKEE